MDYKGLLSLMTFFCLAGNFLFVLFAFEPNEEEILRQVLAKTASYCENLKGLALHFVCGERIEEKIHTFKQSTVLIGDGRMGGYRLRPGLKADKVKKNSYVYDYQMIKKGEEFKERRNLLEENGKKSLVKDVELGTMRMSAKFLVFGPVGFLSPYW